MGVLKIVSSARLSNIKISIPNLTFMCRECHKNENQGNEKESEKEIPEEPTTCCMSGCPNCVWLEYAEKLSQLYKDGGEEAEKLIEEKVTDPNMKAFLLHELRMKKTK